MLKYSSVQSAEQDIYHIVTPDTGSHLGQSQVLVDGLLLAGEALLQLLWEASPAAVDGILAPVLGRPQHHLVKGVLQRLPLQLAIGHLIQHTAERLVVQQVPDVVDS